MSTRRIILIGAARSGTKIVRDSLAAATSVGAVPYDINFVWRYRNESSPDDVLEPEWLSNASQQFITHYMDRYAANGTVLEKTVSNTLRVPFVREAFPEAIFVHLIRDGVDVIESTRTQWLASADRSYVMKKARHFPPRLIPTYGRKYAAKLLRPRRSGEKPLRSWGVRYPGMDRDLQTDGLLSVCARQWRQSVERATAALGSMDGAIINLRYEDLVANPHYVLDKLATDLGLVTASSALQDVASTIKSSNVGKGALKLTAPELSSVGLEVDETLMRLGYDRASTRIERIGR